MWDTATVAEITKFANKLAWTSPDLQVLRPDLAGQYPTIAEILQDHIQNNDERKKLILPDLRAFGNETVAVFSDFGGEHKAANYYTYSTLVCGWNLTDVFLHKMKTVRETHRLGEKEISFKDFGMGQVQRSLPDYLKALDFVPGLLLTVAIDKRIKSLFGTDADATTDLINETLEAGGFGGRKKHVNEKLLRIIHITAFLTGLLAHDGHKLLWVTDHDSISPNKALHENTLKLFQQVLNIYARPGYTFPVLGGALPFEERSVDQLDLLSATDIVAGTLDHYLTKRDDHNPDDILVKSGSDVVIRWLAHNGIGLKKSNIVIRETEDGQLRYGTLDINLTDPPEGITEIPVVV